MEHKHILALLLGCWVIISITACGSKLRPDSPDVKYRSATEYDKLLLPPDTTDNRGSLYIIPKAKGRISRSSILPSTGSASFKRHGEISWLQIELPVEELWPELVKFAQTEGWLLEENDSLEGTLITEWVTPQQTIQRGGFMQKILGSKTQSNKNELERYVLRIERDGDSSRLFARYQLSGRSNAGAAKSWQLKDENPEITARLLTRILVFIGISEQHANEVLSKVDLNALENGLLVSKAKDNSPYLLIWGDYNSAFEKVKQATQAVGFKLRDDDIKTGLIEARGIADYLAVLLEKQNASRKAKKSFFGSISSVFSKPENTEVDLVLSIHRVEPLVFALRVLEDGVEVLKGEQGTRFLSDIKDAIIQESST